MPSADHAEGDSHETDAATELEGGIKVASYNVRSLRDNRAAAVAVVKAIAPDVLILQEAPRFWFWRTRCEAFARRCGLTIVAGGDGGGHGNLILARRGISVERSKILSLPKTPGLHSRAVVSATCRVAGESVTFMGFHLGLDATERAEHARLILADIVALEDNVALEGGAVLAGAAPDAPATLPRAVIAAGDLNEPPDGPVWELFRAKLIDTTGDDDTASFSTRSPRRRIDAVFVSRSARRWECQVWREPPVVFASDHFPVVARIWRPSGTARPEPPHPDRPVPQDPDSGADRSG